MVKIENVETYGFEAAIRGMRNPMNSWARSDSSGSDVGENDQILMRQLFMAGTEHRKYLRMITVTMDVTAPLYWWKEYDTYKIGTVANSCSTMHKLQSKEFTDDDFSHEHLDPVTKQFLEAVINSLNVNRDKFNATKDKQYWWNMIQLLPSSYNQRRTVMFNYEVALTMIRQRSDHKLDEWREFVEQLKQLPYMNLFE